MPDRQYTIVPVPQGFRKSWTAGLQESVFDMRLSSFQNRGKFINVSFCCLLFDGERKTPYIHDHNILKLLSIIVTFFSPFLLIFLCKTLSNCLFNTYCINYNCSCKIREIILLLYKNLNCWTKTIIIMTNSLSHYIVCCILLINCWNKNLILND